MSTPHLSASDVSSGLPAVGAVPWGSHLCHFYRSREDLTEPLVSYFRQGLDNNEQCLWITGAPLGADLARRALEAEVPDLARRERAGQIEIIDHSDWYARSGKMDGESVLRSWLDREQAALARGFTGLRITGNTFWLERSEWESFADYEAAVHEAFRGRSILALCSYSLERCTIDDVLEVLRNHEFALVRRDGAWELIRSATHLVAAVHGSTARPARNHEVHFYSRERYPAEAIARFLADGLEAGCPAAAIATAPHREAIAKRLEALGVAPGAVEMFDAESIIDRSTIDGALDLDRVQRTFSAALARLAPARSRLYVYGEAVDVLCRRDQPELAIALERVWNEILETRDVALFCGYDLTSFRSTADAGTYLTVCGTHSAVSVDPSPEDQWFVARALQRRRDLEAATARRATRESDAHRRLEALQRATSALSTVGRLEQLQAVLDRDICAAVGATQVCVAIQSAGSDKLHMACRAGVCGEVAGFAEQTDQSNHSEWLSDRDQVVERFARLAPEVEALASLPLRVLERRIGAIVFAFPESQAFDPPQRALIEDIAHQVTLTADRALLFEEIEAQRNQMARANEAKDQFLAMLGHELRNPLAAIRTATELVGQSCTGDSGRRAHEVLVRQTAHMTTLLDGLLDVSRIARGKIKIEKKPVDVSAVLESVLHDGFAGAAIEIREEIAGPDLWILGDEVRLAQIIDNLLSNAIKFSRPGGVVTVTARAEGDQVIVTVRDTGEGIHPELLPYVFEPFQQGAQELSRSHGGLGLGLSVVKGLVELHGGTVTALSDGPDRGAELRVALPLHRGPRPARSTTPRLGRRAGAKILVVEDNVDAAEMLRMLLETRGHELAVAHDGETALEQVSTFNPDVVLCDIGLPGGMTGYDLASRLRQDPRLAGTILVALTGYGRPEDARRARDAGFDHHLIKPVELASVQGVLDGLRR